VYGFTELIVGTLDLIKIVGIISIAPPIAMAMVAKMVKNTGFLSHALCQNSPVGL
jgi:hypothetical protein